MVCRRQGHYDQAAEYHQQALALSREIGDRDGEADALNGAGETLLATGQPGRPALPHHRARPRPPTGNQHEQARALTRLGEVCHRQGHHDKAAEYTSRRWPCSGNR